MSGCIINSICTHLKHHSGGNREGSRCFVTVSDSCHGLWFAHQFLFLFGPFEIVWWCLSALHAQVLSVMQSLQISWSNADHPNTHTRIMVWLNEIMIVFYFTLDLYCFSTEPILLLYSIFNTNFICSTTKSLKGILSCLSCWLFFCTVSRLFITCITDVQSYNLHVDLAMYS